jgi:hypothetical protein
MQQHARFFNFLEQMEFVLLAPLYQILRESKRRNPAPCGPLGRPEAVWPGFCPEPVFFTKNRGVPGRSSPRCDFWPAAAYFSLFGPYFLRRHWTPLPEI